MVESTVAKKGRRDENTLKYSKTRESIGIHFPERNSWNTLFPGGLFCYLQRGVGTLDY